MEEEDPKWKDLICEKCFLNTPEYAELTEYSDLFYLVTDYIARHKLGLQDPASVYSEREIQAILLVNGELERQRQEWMKNERENKDGGEYLTDNGDGQVEG